MSDASKREKHEAGWKWLLAIFLTAMAYRAGCFCVMGRHSLLSHPVVDAGYHDAWAQRIAAGDILGHGPDDVFKPPAYPYALAGLYTALGRSIVLVQWVQYVLGALSCVLVAVVASRLLGAVTGRVAGFLSSVYAPYVFFESQLLTPATGIFLNLAAIALLLGNRERRTYIRFVSAGLLFGLSAAVRPDVLPPAGLIVAYLLWRDRHRPRWKLLGSALGIALGAAAVLLAVTLRNYHNVRSFVPISSNAGINFYVGNTAGSDGASAVPVGLQWERLVARAPQPILERPAEASRWWMRRGWERIAADPGAALVRLGRKVAALVNRREFRNNICFHFMQQDAWLLRMPFLQYWMVLPLAVAGLLGLRRGGNGLQPKPCILCLLWVGGYGAAGVAFFVTARYRLPMVPLLIAPAAWAAVRIFEAVRCKERKALVRMGCVVLLAGAVCWPPWLGRPESGWVRDYVNLGNSLRMAGDYRGASGAYRSALAVRAGDADAHFLLAQILLGQGAVAEARWHLERAREVIGDSPDLLLTSARACLAGRDPAGAREHLQRLVALQETCNLWPKRAEWATAHIMLANLAPSESETHWREAWRIHPATAAEAAFLGRKDLPRVLETFRSEAEREPWNWYAQANYGLALLETGRPAEAVAPLDRAADLAPEGKEGVGLHLARALAASGRGGQAVDVLTRLCRSLPDGALRRRAEVLLNRLSAGRK